MCCCCLSDICLLFCWQICWLSPHYLLLRWVHLSKLFRFIQSTPRNIKSTMEYLEYTKLYSPGAFSDHCCSRWPLYYLGTISRLSRRYLQTTQHDIKYSQSTDIISNIAKIKWSIIKITSDMIQITSNITEITLNITQHCIKHHQTIIKVRSTIAKITSIITDMTSNITKRTSNITEITSNVTNIRSNIIKHNIKYRKHIIK